MLRSFEPIRGEWYIEEELGQGSFGTVYSAYRMLAGKKEYSAIKHISLPKNQSDLKSIQVDLGTSDPEAVKERLNGLRDELISEYMQMKEFKGQTNIVSCEDVHWIEKKDMPGYDIFIRMELLECVSNQILDGKIDRRETIKLGIDICNALTLLRNKNIVHRDVKPQNIFVNNNGDYKLGDFGTARNLQGTSAAMSMRGTFAYMSPEAMKGERTGYTSDIYSLGLVMYRLLNGNKSPFLLPGQASTVTQEDAANMRRLQGEELPPPSDADKGLAKIILRACAYDPKDRWQSADAMQNALEGLLNGTIHRKTETDTEVVQAQIIAETARKQQEKEKQEKEKKEKEQEQQDKTKKQKKIITIIAACIVLVAAGILGVHAMNQSKTYKNAVQAINDGHLEAAKEGFSSLGNYKDAPQQLEYVIKEQERQTTYQKAQALMQEGNYLEAMALFRDLGDYSDANAQLTHAQAQVTENERKAQFSQAEALETEGKYEDAMAIYAALGNYSNAEYHYQTLSQKIKSYEDAKVQENRKNFENAKSLYESAGQYLDAEVKAKEMEYQLLYNEAKQYEDIYDFSRAAGIYQELAQANFLDAADKQAAAEENILKELQYQAALDLLKNKKWDDAITAFEAIPTYRDADTQIKKSHFEKAEILHAEGLLADALHSYELAGDYSNAVQKKKAVTEEITENERKAQFSQAEALEAEGKYEDAMAIYAALGNYSYAESQLENLKQKITSYNEATLREQTKEYEKAKSLYEAAGKYKNAEAKAKEMLSWSRYTEAQQKMEDKEFDKAIVLYQNLTKENFRDSATLLKKAEKERERALAEPVKITVQPKDVTVTSGTNATTSITATGDGLKYAWYYKESQSKEFERSGETSATYTLKMNHDVSGRQIYCIISDQYGNKVTSNIVTFIATTPLKITSQPKDVTVTSGTKATTSITATGDGLKYLWYYADKGSETFSRSSESSNTYSLEMNPARSGRRVYCVVMDQYGNKITSNTITLVATTPLKITKQPENKKANVNETIKLTINVTGDGLKYQWYAADAGNSNFSASGKNTPNYELNLKSSHNGRRIYCIITDQYGHTVQTNTVTVTVYELPKIIKQPVNASAPSKENASVSVTAEGEGLSYRWYYKAPGDTEFKKTKSTTNTYSLQMSSSRDGYKVYCEITNKFGASVKTNTVTLSLKNNMIVYALPKTLFASKGDLVQLKLSASGDGLTYKWQYKDPHEENFSDAGQRWDTYSLTMGTLHDGRQVRCVVRDKHGNEQISTVVTLNLMHDLVITTQPKDVARPKGKLAKVSFTVEGDKPFTYRWYYADRGDSVFKNGPVKVEYELTMNANVNGRRVYCEVTDRHGNTVRTNIVTLTMSKK